MRSTSSSPTEFGPIGAPAATLRARFGEAAMLFVFFSGVVIALLWNTMAARRIRGSGWPVAILKGLVVVTCGMIIDSVMSVVAVMLSLQLA